MHLVKKETSRYNRGMKSLKDFKRQIWKINRHRVKQELHEIAKDWHECR